MHRYSQMSVNIEWYSSRKDWHAGAIIACCFWVAKPKKVNQ